MATNKDLAELIFPDIHKTIKDLEKLYPERDLPEGAEVTRFAPSPTGFLHTGSLFTALIAYKFAKQTKGVYFFRLEDTDQKREVKGTGLDLVRQLKNFGIVADEGYFGDSDKGEYGPYEQSKRAEIYKICIKELIKKGRAYPCFCTKEELDELRLVQEANKVIPGYYGEYAKCRHYSVDEAIALIKEGKPYVIRFKSKGNHLNHIRVHDEIRGDMDLSENDQDIVILKSDGLPTYHFAHLVDDHFMRTTLITRGEEWISSLPIHIELFQTMGWKLFTIANSNFEAWLMENPKGNLDDFRLTFDKFSLDGALFDLPKLNNISKEVLSHMDKKSFTDECLHWAKEHDEAFASFIEKDRERFENIINIEREQEKPRKDYEKYSDVFPKIRFFDRSFFEESVLKGIPFNEHIDKKTIEDLLLDFKKTLELDVDEEQWFSSMKALGTRHGFADDRKVYKKDPTAYRGWYADSIAIVRAAISGTTNTPKLYDTLRILGREEILSRVDFVLAHL